ncbi:DUF3253 domain-containing protein [Aquimarina sp. M1]
MNFVKDKFIGVNNCYQLKISLSHLQPINFQKKGKMFACYEGAISTIKEAHLKFAKSRETNCTYCPSEVARALFPESWRNQMDNVRQVADDLVESGHLVTLQKGKVISEKATEAKGPIRLRKK